MKKKLRNSLLLLLVVAPAVHFAAALTADFVDVTASGTTTNTIGVSATPTVVVGWNNANNTGAQNTLLVGNTLGNSSSNSVTIGTYNTLVGNSALVIGNGISGSPRNSLEVLTSGAVNVPLGGVSTPKVTIGTASTTLPTQTMKIYGTADIAGVPEKGGISMGAYSAP